MAKDLIAKYGEGHGVSESELRVSLKIRNGIFAGIGVVVLGLLYGLYLIHPLGPVILLGVAAGFGVIAGAVNGIIWMSDNMPEHFTNIKRAKEYGVRDDG